MATINLGRIKPVFRGAYSGGTAYVVDDIVTSGGSSYICIQAHGAGTQAVTVTAYWSVLSSIGDAGGVGLRTMWIPAMAMISPTTNGAALEQVETTATRPDLKVLDFDASTAEYAQFSVAMPKSWNLSTVTFQAFWTPGSTNTGNCIWGLQGVGCADGDTGDVVFGTAGEVTDAGIATIEDIQVTSVSSAITIAGTPADDDVTFYQVYRDAADGSDTFSADARLIGIKLFFTTDAATDT